MDSRGIEHTAGIVLAHLRFVIRGQLLVSAVEELAVVSGKATLGSGVVATDAPRLRCHRTIHIGIDDVDNVADKEQDARVPAAPTI